jgi:NADPH:quinone reductase
MIFPSASGTRNCTTGSADAQVAGDQHPLDLAFPLEQTAQAHRAVRDGTVGKVLVDVTA